ncbi:TBC1 domain family member 2B-like [Corticium candelabrum]|uniref:TBC1 domain family member 2B-like n=1 Tax=Corticium candelabrum TaxID=121492 RepID=UPI002E268A52|nr:TBC1 domain family member 2B-like [Corticium candelabrum]
MSTSAAVSFVKTPDGVASISVLPETADQHEDAHSVPERSNEAQSNSSKKSLTGYLVKQSAKGPIKWWHNQWFVFDDRRCMLIYYRSPKDFAPLGSIDIAKASFSFDVENVDKGQFNIRVDGRVFMLQAQSKKAMMFWLSELQERRRQFSQRQLHMPKKKLSAASKHLQPRGGLAGSAEELESPLTSIPTSDSVSSTSGLFDLSLSSLKNISFLHRSGSTAGQKASRAVLTARANVAQMKAKEQKQSEANSPASAPLIDFTDGDQERVEAHSDGSGGKNDVSLMQKWKGALGWSISLESVKKKMMKRSTTAPTSNSLLDIQPSSSPASCKTSEDEIQTVVALKDDLEATERELSAKSQVICNMQRELRELQLQQSATEQFIAKSCDKDRLQLLVKRDQKIIQLEEAKMTAEEDKLDVEQQLRECGHKLSDAEEQLSMFKEMLEAKDHVVMNLTNQLFELEQKDPDDVTKRSTDSNYGIVTESGYVPLPSDTIQQLQRYKDMCEGYKMQNSFLNSEVLELNQLRADDGERMKELAESVTAAQAELCKVRSENLLLLQPRRGGESGPSQDMISQLLEDAMASDLELSGVDTEQREAADRYGFKHDFHKDDTNAFEIMADRLLQQSHRLQDTDAAHVVRWENYILIHEKKPLEYTAELKNLIRGGIPPEYRTEMWTLCVHSLTQDIKAKKGSGYYQQLVASHSHSATSVFFKQIELDLLRTMPNNKFYDRPDADGVTKLRNVLRAYACHNPAVGYCQGLNRLVAIALLCMDEENAFWCLIAIVEVLMPPDYYTQTLLASQVDQRVLKDVLSEKMPHLHAHFDHYSVDLSLITFNWFLTVFVDNTPIELAMRIWDSFLYEGSKVLFRFALAIFKFHEEPLLAIDNSMTLYNFARVIAHKCHDLKRLSHIAFNDMNPFSMKTVTAKRTTYTATVKAELQELENIRSRCQKRYSFHDNHGSGRAGSDDEG